MGPIAVPTKPHLQAGYIPITSYLQPEGNPTGHVSLVTHTTRDHTPKPEMLAARPNLLTLCEGDKVHIVWIQAIDHDTPVAHWAYANLVQTSSETRYKTRTVQALADQHARATKETSRLLSVMEQETHAYHSTTTGDIADLQNELQRHLDETHKLNTNLQQKIDDQKDAFASYKLPDEGSS